MQVARFCWGAVLLPLALYGCSCSVAGNGVRPGAVDPTPNTAAAAGRILAPVIQRYATCRAYRDRGSLADTAWRGGSRSTEIFRFDTAFVRDVGLRFRFFDERGHLKHAIWQHAGKILTWSMGNVRRSATPEEAVDSLKGVTSFASSIVPSLLLGVRLLHGEEAVVDREPALTTSASPTIDCGRCSLIVFGLPERRQFLFTIDEAAGVFRRSEALLRLEQGSSAGVHSTDTLITYEPEFDFDPLNVQAELETQPW